MTETKKSEEGTRREAHWPRVLFQLYIQAMFLYGIYFIVQAQVLTLAYCAFLTGLSALSVTAGAHRLWAHRSYSARPGLRLFLMLCHTMGGTGPIYDWVLDHRIHHKFHGTDDDPFNYKKGFIYAHFGSKMVADAPNKPELVKQVDMSDVEKDRIVMFQKRFYWVLMPIFALLLPVNAPVEYWGESMVLSLMSTAFRIPFMFHFTWLVNSARSIWGLEPGDRFYSDSNLVFLIRKNHWHAYHHAAPWDFLTGEFGSYDSGCTTAFLKIWSAMGLAGDFKTIDSGGTTRALLEAAASGKSIADCLTEEREDAQLKRYDEGNVSFLATKCGS